MEKHSPSPASSPAPDYILGSGRCQPSDGAAGYWAGVSESERNLRLERWYAACSEEVLGLARKLVCNEEDALDLCADAVALAMVSACSQQFDPLAIRQEGDTDEQAARRNFRAYLCTILRNRCISRWRNRAVGPAFVSLHELSGEWMPAPAADEPEHAYENREASRRLRDAVASLREPYRETVWMRLVEDAPVASVASALNVSRLTVRSRCSRALKTLRRDLRLRVYDPGTNQALAR